MTLRVVVDTNALVSRLLLPGSAAGLAVRRIVDEARLLVSDALMAELAHVLARPKFDRYVTVDERQDFIRLLGRIAVPVPILQRIRACRDPTDDMILELAVNGRADLIVSGDADLLALHPFMGIPIQRPSGRLILPPRPLSG
jgi:putative PIN family toxin of toxin-antitoxin system